MILEKCYQRVSWHHQTIFNHIGHLIANNLFHMSHFVYVTFCQIQVSNENMYKKEKDACFTIEHINLK